MRMKAEDKAKWLEALRSGEYRQIEGSLCRDGGYCCLGVLETILDGEVETNLGTPLSSPSCDFLHRHNIEVELRSADPSKFPSEGGVVFPTLDYNGVYAKLMERNDEMEVDDEAEPIDGQHVYSFKDIANYIEKNVEVYE